MESMNFTIKDVLDRLNASQTHMSGKENIERWIKEVAADNGDGTYTYEYINFPNVSAADSFMAWIFYPIDVPRDHTTEMIGNSHFPHNIKIGHVRDAKETLARLALACTLKNFYACEVIQKYLEDRVEKEKDLEMREFLKEEVESYREKAEAYRNYTLRGIPVKKEHWNPVYPLALFGLGALTGAAIYGLADSRHHRPHHHHRHY